MALRRWSVVLVSLLVAYTLSLTGRANASVVPVVAKQPRLHTLASAHRPMLTRQQAERQSQVNNDATSCILGFLPATPVPTPTGTPVPSTPGTVGTGGGQGCLASVSPAEAFNQVGQPHTVTFTCGAATSFLVVPAGAGAGFSGCYDVQALVTDATTGGASSATNASCGNFPAVSNGAFDCTNVFNPICSVGTAPLGPGICSPCPSGYTFAGGQCHTAPNGTTCPPGTQPVNPNPAGVPADCVGPVFSGPGAANQATVTINPGAPHVYRVDFTGYVGTNPGGSCPTGTTFAPSVNFTPALAGPTQAHVTGPGCAFTVTAFKKYLEVTKIDVIPLSDCGGTIDTQINAQIGGVACSFRIRVLGTVVLKQGVDCSVEPNGAIVGTPEPVAGPEPNEDGVEDYTETNAEEAQEGVPEGTDPGGVPPATYQCVNGALDLLRVVPNALVSISVQNGVFPAPFQCIPQAVAQQAFATPVPTATGTLTPIPTPTPIVMTPTTGPTPTPIVSAPSEQKFCAPVGNGTNQVVTGPNGEAPFVPHELEVSAIPSLSGPVAGVCPYQPVVASNDAGVGPTVYICGRILADDVGLANAGMSAVFNYPSNPPPTQTCLPLNTAPNGESLTDENGRAVCYENGIFGPNFFGTDQVPVDVYFDLPAPLEGTACRTQTYFVRARAATPIVPTRPVVTQCQTSQVGFSVVRTGFGPVVITATAVQTSNTQPPITSGPVTLGVFSLPGPAPTNTAEAGPTATNTPVPTMTPTAAPSSTPTNTPIPTPTSTPTNTPTSTPIPTNTPIPTLRFSLDAARVAQPHNSGNKQGLDVVQPGQTVWLMMYYTVKSVPKTVTRITTYEIRYGSQSVFKIAFKGSVKPTDLGARIRYTVLTLSRTMPFGVYEYRATLTLGGRSQTRIWHFAVVKAGGLTVATKFLAAETP